MTGNDRNGAPTDYESIGRASQRGAPTIPTIPSVPLWADSLDQIRARVSARLEAWSAASAEPVLLELRALLNESGPHGS
jgi:hypothetical protein